MILFKPGFSPFLSSHDFTITDFSREKRHIFFEVRYNSKKKQKIDQANNLLRAIKNE